MITSRLWLIALCFATITTIVVLYVMLSVLSSHALPTSDFVPHTMHAADNSMNSSTLRLSQSLFCPLWHPLDLRTYNTMLTDIEHLQFSSPCKYNSDARYFVFDVSPNAWGVFSTWDNHHIPAFTLSLGTRRTFLMHTPHHFRLLPHSNGASIPELCGGRTGRLCVFKAESNCDATQVKEIIDAAQTHGDLFVLGGTQCLQLVELGIDSLDKFAAHTANYSVIQYKHTLYNPCELWMLQQSMNRALTENISRRLGYNVSYDEFNALALSFLLRMQDDVRRTVEGNVSAVLRRYGFTSPLSTVSLAVRASDKCWSHGRQGEMRCPNASDYMQAVQDLAARFANESARDIDAVIVTSEDRDVVALFKGNVSAAHPRWRFIFNDADVLPNSGNPYELRKGVKANNDSALQLFDVGDDAALFALLLSMLSSLRLQMNANYVVTAHIHNLNF